LFSSCSVNTAKNRSSLWDSVFLCWNTKHLIWVIGSGGGESDAEKGDQDRGKRQSELLKGGDLEMTFEIEIKKTFRGKTNETENRVEVERHGVEVGHDER
jgi:hypothetical protein